MFHRCPILILVMILSTPLITFAQQNSESSETKETNTPLLIGDHQGINDADARSAALLIALELRKLGISIDDPVYEVPASANVYRVTLNRLGEKILVRLSQEMPIGTIVIERQLLIANIEEMIAAAPRLVDAVVHNKPMDSTVDIETVTDTEARELRKVTGESHGNIGFFGAFVPGTEVSGTPGYRAGWSYELPTYAVESEGRIFFGEDTHYAAFSVGGMYFLNKHNTSPYVGGGLTVSNASHEGEFERGMGAYVSGGIQMLRTTKNRLKFEIRVDRPFYQLENQDVMPIAIGLFFSRSGSGCCLLGF